MKIIHDKNSPERIVIDISTNPEESDDLRFKNIAIMSDYDDLDEFKKTIIDKYLEDERRKRDERFEEIDELMFVEISDQIVELLDAASEKLKIDNLKDLHDYVMFLNRKHTYRQISAAIQKNVKIKKKSKIT